MSSTKTIHVGSSFTYEATKKRRILKKLFIKQSGKIKHLKIPKRFKHQIPIKIKDQ
jgi:hypothetical protein